jgi:hypothetical protein
LAARRRGAHFARFGLHRAAERRASLLLLPHLTSRIASHHLLSTRASLSSLSTRTQRLSARASPCIVAAAPLAARSAASAAASASVHLEVAQAQHMTSPSDPAMLATADVPVVQMGLRLQQGQGP